MNIVLYITSLGTLLTLPLQYMIAAQYSTYRIVFYFINKFVDNFRKPYLECGKADSQFAVVRRVISNTLSMVYKDGSIR